ncbi:MAG: ArsR/SmtB family transcription factor [Thermodesulfobacteriota bacterium]
MTENNFDVCQTHNIHTDKIEKARENMPQHEVLRKVSELFKVLSDSTRIRILQALANAELCVCDLTEVLQMNSSAVSHQLRILRAAGLVGFRREGKNVFYSLQDSHVQDMISIALQQAAMEK